MNKSFLLLGSNLGNPEKSIRLAVKLIQENIGHLLSKSSIYKSAPWGFEGENYFLNQVLIINTLLNENELLDTILDIEKKMGRIRNSLGYENRIIDIDILFFESICLNTTRLTIPHPLIEQRRFTLMPLAEIAPEFIHPLNGKTMQELLQNCTDKGDVNIIC